MTAAAGHGTAASQLWLRVPRALLTAGVVVALADGACCLPAARHAQPHRPQLQLLQRVLLAGDPPTTGVTFALLVRQRQPSAAQPCDAPAACSASQMATLSSRGPWARGTPAVPAPRCGRGTGVGAIYDVGPGWGPPLAAEGRAPQTENAMLSSVCVPAACLQIKVWAQCGGTDSPYGQSGADPSLCW